ncbi:MAG TPA: peptide-methionine (S)-S-oxide reductase MsrA [Chitinophagaceae bacterium]|jgi:peptide-methionine (S)-S-oxide reductase|nr:peptide-methionine (S)-S-oxide reductase MsrA [Chitinophagaceae bacterium]
MKYNILPILSMLIFTLSCGAKEGTLQNKSIFDEMESKNKTMNKIIDTATVGGGCFWCTEAQLQQLNGVLTVTSGYAGGSVANPTYKEVCTGLTGHAEVIQVTFDPSIISYDELLAAFWQAHDPTQLNRQGNDIGTQYRSVIFYHNEEQKRIAEDYKKRLNDEKAYDQPVVTEVSPLPIFYKGEDYHQNYFNQNASQGYCQFVIQPKLDKFKKVFKDKLKK